MKINQLFLFFLALCLFSNCSKSGKVEEIVIEIPIPETETVEVSEFYFKAANNPSLLEDLKPVEVEGVYTATLPKYGNHRLIPTFTSTAVKATVADVEQISAVTESDFTNEIIYVFIGKRGTKKEIKVKINWIDFDVPEINITTEGAVDITSKETYVKATVSIDGKSRYTNFEGATEVRGRGNSTWSQPKKPYRLKLSEKSEILGLPKAKNWVLLANYLDPSLMCNAVAMKIGRDLKVPFTHTIIPVDLKINGVYKGSYTLTQHIEVDENRVNIGSNGYLFELDTYYDEEFKFKSASYNLPVMIKGPELDAQSEVAPIQADFQAMENLIKAPEFPNNSYKNLLDIEGFAKYILVYFLTGNEEINHPKSTYMHKKAGGKYSFGPIWDFDWAYGYEGTFTHFSTPTKPLFKTGKTIGGDFFKRLFEDPAVKAAFKSQWQLYKQNHLNNLLKFVDEYSALIKASKARDEVVWKKGKDFDAEVVKLKKYIQDRATYLDTYVSGY